MPWKLQKTDQGYFVIDDKGKRYSDKPMSREQAVRQMRALYTSGKRSFSVFKQADGSYRWVLVSGSAFIDRDGETVTTKAMQEDVERCDKTKEYGPLRWFHMGGWEAPDGIEHWDTWKAGPGVDLGTCDFNMMHGRMLLESGTFKTPEIGEAFGEVADQLEVSLGFSHPPDEPDESKEFNNIHRFERSLLPAGMASNLLTKVYVTKGEHEDMNTKQKLAALAAILKGKPDVAKAILDDVEAIQKAAETSGLAFKEVETLIQSGDVEQEDPPAEETPDESPEPVVEGEEEVPPDELAGADKDPESKEKKPMMPAPDDEEDEEPTIGDWSAAKLEAFVGQVIGKFVKAQATQAKKETDPALSEAIAVIGQQAEKISKLEQSLAELTDARPAGIKQLQSLRPSARDNNVVATEPAGPAMDPAFRNFVSGGK